VFLFGRIWRPVSVALDGGWRIHFSPQPSYQLRKCGSQFARRQSGLGPIHFESISLNRDSLAAASMLTRSIGCCSKCRQISGSRPVEVEILRRRASAYDSCSMTWSARATSRLDPWNSTRCRWLYIFSIGCRSAPALGQRYAKSVQKTCAKLSTDLTFKRHLYP
jgi:hypothetical protein